MPPSSLRGWAYRIVAIVVVLAISAIYLAVTVHMPDFFGTVLRQTFMTQADLQELVVLATPFFLTALAVLIPMRVGLWNIGGEGQFFAGAWLATWFSFSMTHLPGPLLIVGMLLAGALGGALWATIPMLAKVLLNVNEIISTLMLNLVMVLWVTYWIAGPWMLLSALNIESRFIPNQAHLPLVHLGGGLDSGLIIAVAITVVVGVTLRYSIFGYRTFVVGAGRAVALFTGVRIRRTLMASFLLGGALAGIAGVLQLAGNSYQLTPGLSNNTGYLGIAVAILAGGSVVGVGVMACLLAVIMLIGQTVQIYGVSSEAVFIVIGLLLLFTTVGEALSQYQLIRRPSEDSAVQPSSQFAGPSVERVAPEGLQSTAGVGGVVGDAAKDWVEDQGKSP
jgi:simple sugar transport system permease protein